MRADPRPVADPERPQDLRVRADDDIVAQGRMPLCAAGQRGAAEGHSLIKRAVIADLGGLADDYAHAVIDKQPPADARAGVDLDPRQHPPQMRHEPPGKQPAAPPQPMGEAMKNQRMKPRIAQRHLDTRPGGGIAGERRVYFVAQVFQQHRYHYIISSLRRSRRISPRGRRERAYNCPTKMIKNCDLPSNPACAGSPTRILGYRVGGFQLD